MGPIHTSAVTRLEDAIVLCTHPDMFKGTDVERWQRIEQRARLTRFGGDCVNYGYLASGYADLVIECGLEPYDVIPLIPIVEAAGGIITGLDGQPPLEGGWAIAGATAELHASALTALHGD